MPSVESKRTVFKRRLLQLPPRWQSAWKGKVTIVFSCSEIADTNMTKENLRKEKPSEVVVFQERKIKKRAGITNKGNARTPREFRGILLCVRLTNRNRDANSAKSVCLGTLRLTVSLSKKSKKSGGRGSVALLKNSKQVGCVVQDTEPPISDSNLWKSTKIFGIRSHRAFLKKARYTTQ